LALQRLIETTLELTNLKQFLGSDYLLGHLGYTPDNTQREKSKKT